MAKIISKILLFIFNVVYFLAALAILVIGAMTLAGDEIILDMLNLIHDTSLVVAILDWKELTLPASIYLVTLGSLALLLSIIGAFGIFKDHKFILIFFGISKLCIILFNLALIMYNAILPFHGHDLVTSLMKTNLESNFEPVGLQYDEVDGSYPVVMPTVNSSAWHWAKMEFEQACCAAGNSTDYESVLRIWNDEQQQIVTDDDNRTVTSDPSAPYTNSTVMPGWTGWTKNATVSATCCMQIDQYVIPGDVSDFVNVTGCLASSTSYVNYRGCSDYVMSLILAYRQVYIIVAASFVALEIILIALIARISDRSRSVGSV